jgi:DNA-binding HxlR family transcriptional regulator
MAARISRSNPVTVNDVLDGQKRLEIDCLDRIYLSLSVPNLMVGGQVVGFLTGHEGQPIPSPALLERRGQTFRRAVESFARSNNIPVISFTGKKDQRRPGVLADTPWPERKIDQVMPLIRKAAATGRSQVVAVGVAQEFQRVFTGTKSEAGASAVWFTYQRTERRVTCYYFYVWDADFGPAFIKICAYFPYPGKIWINGHEWAKRQATQAGIGFRELSNGFAACDDPAALQAICDRFGPGTVTVFAERWWARLPLPFTPTDRAAGYWWDIAMRQIEIAKTIVFTAPRHARNFFEALTADNLDIGRPDNMEIIFNRQIRSTTHGVFRTAVDRDNDGVVVNAFYRRSRIKYYLKDRRALRIETVINDTYDLRVLRRLEHLDELIAKARDVNRRLLDTIRVGQGCVLASPALERVAQPTLTEDGRRAPALRFGDPRVMALTGALCLHLFAVTGVTNKRLRALTARLLGTGYSTSQMTYDLRRLRLNGLIQRVEHTHTYTLTPDGQRLAIFYTKLHDRLLRPLTAADQPQAPPELRHALATIDQHVQDYITRARLQTAA